jgi:hypothetical protein
MSGSPTSGLLAVDVGLRCGLAFYDRSGRLRSYRSRNFGSVGRLKKRVFSLLQERGGLEYLFLEGGGRLSRIWLAEATKQQIMCVFVSAEQWRTRLIHPRHRRSGQDAKKNARRLAHDVIDWSAAPRPKATLRDDAAEAILIGLWGVLQVGWLSALPPQLGG